MDKPANREREIFNAALELTSIPEREAYLNESCAADAELRARVEILLRSHDEAGNFLAAAEKAELPAAGKTLVISTSMIQLTEKAGDKIGRYRLLQQIGEGGCGVVYMAEQEEPVRRRVALKVIKLGLDTKQVIARFEAERQALALMDHPNIAKVLDAGATETGRPYFVMELVRGVRITDYCDQVKLSTKERLALFVQVCQAIQHAHQKGIIHRDIKPSNILVTLHDGEPVPKVIDFGIAKATTNQRLTDKTLFTAFEQFMGTPAYMSPEQAEMSGLDIDTRSDIYALGVLLYELLTGKTPFDARELIESGLDAMRKTIREKEPVRPSARLSTMAGETLTTTAGLRQTEAPKLVHSVRGDLDWVVMKCLEKNRSRRYESANGLAMDIQRHINSEPVAARPPSLLYVLQKLIRRNKLAFAAAGAVFVALIIGLIGTGVGFLQAEKQRRVAEATERVSQENFDQARTAVGDLLSVSDEDLYAAPGMQPLRQKMMLTAIERYKKFLEKSPKNPAVRAELARLYAAYGFAAHGNGEDIQKVIKPAFEAALSIQRQLIAEYPTNREIQSDLGWTLIFAPWSAPGFRGASEEAAAIFQKQLQADPTNPIIRADLAWALWQNGFYTSVSNGLAMQHQARVMREELLAEFPRSAELRRDLAKCLQLSPDHSIDDLERARKLQETLKADLENHAPDIWVPTRGADSEARILRPSLHWALRDLVMTYTRTAGWHMFHNEMDKTVELARRGIEIYNQLIKENPSIGNFSIEQRLLVDDLANAYIKQNHPEAAQKLIEDQIAFTKKIFGEDNATWLLFASRQIQLLQQTHQSNDVEQAELRKAIQRIDEVHAPTDKLTLYRLSRMASYWEDLNQPSMGLLIQEKVVQWTRAALGTRDRQTLLRMDMLGWLHLDLLHTNQAVALFEETLNVAKDSFKSDEVFIADRMTSLAEAYRESGRLAEARKLLESAIAIYRSSPTNDVSDLVEATTYYTHTLLDDRAFVTAEKVVREILPLAEKKAATKTPLLKHFLGFALGGQKQFAEGEPLLIDGYNQMNEGPEFVGRHRQMMNESIERIVQFYTYWGKTNEAAEWQKKVDNDYQSKN